MPTIRFLGAAGQVTGSCYLISSGHDQVVVDCGLFQGGKSTFMQNYEPFGFPADKIDNVILTHAHADHCGRLPLLAKRGFTGSIHTHAAAADLAQIILLDSAHIHEKEAEWRTRKNRRKGRAKIDPLYTTPDAEEVLDAFQRISLQRYDQDFRPVLLHLLRRRAHLGFVYRKAGRDKG